MEDCVSAEEVTRLRDELSRLRRVRDAAVRWFKHNELPDWVWCKTDAGEECEECDLRRAIVAALDAAKSGDDVEVDDGTRKKSKA